MLKSTPAISLLWRAICILIDTQRIRNVVFSWLPAYGLFQLDIAAFELDASAMCMYLPAPPPPPPSHTPPTSLAPTSNPTPYSQQTPSFPGRGGVVFKIDKIVQSDLSKPLFLNNPYCFLSSFAFFGEKKSLKKEEKTLFERRTRKKKKKKKKIDR